MYRGVSDEEAQSDWASAGEKEALAKNWRDVVGWSAAMKEQGQFRVLEVSILECTWEAVVIAVMMLGFPPPP